MDPYVPNAELDLLDAFRNHYYRFEAIVREVTTQATDSTVLARIGDDLDEYAVLLAEVTQFIILKFLTDSFSSTRKYFPHLNLLRFRTTSPLCGQTFEPHT